ncbi:MAG TPA: tetratricopeptide repeat protein, partial [Thermoanaerobaculia bacterium]|nr:tetratricopeptide repeat protein [Thermoanaerobaculia bacterium]
RDSEALGAYKVALEPIEKAFAKNETVEPIHARAYANLGAIYLRQKQWQQAADAYGKALRLEPESSSALYNLGFIHFSTNRFELAENEYRKALALDPSLPLAYLHLGELALKRGDAPAAVKLLRDGMERFDAETKVVALRTLGRAELARGDRAAAAAAFALNSNDLESLLALGRIHRQEQRVDDARRVLDEAQRIAPDNRAVMYERLLVARDAAQERALLEDILRRDTRAELWPLRAQLALLLVRGASADARKQLEAAIATAPQTQAETVTALREARALLLAREGKLADAAKALQDFPADALAQGNLGLILWQLGRANDAKPHLVAAQATGPAWSDITLAAGEIALAERNYDRAADLLGVAARCEAHPEADIFELGAGDNCNRAKQSLAIALIGQAVEQIDRRSTRNARQLLERAADLPMSKRAEAATAFLRGITEVLGGSLGDAREAFNRASALGLEAPSRRYLEQIAEATREPERERDPVSDQPRRTVVIFLPDAPAENEKKLAESMNAMVAQIASASSVPLTTELFRRGDDARAFIASNRDKVGIVIANPEFVPDDFRAKFQFVRDGKTTYRRVVVVPAASRIQSLADLRGHT